MRTVDYSEVLNGSAAMSGMGPPDIGTGEFTLFRPLHDRRLQQAWELHHWPDICRTEQRLFRPFWNPATTYAGPTPTSAAEVYDVPTSTYYQSLVAGNLNNPPTINGVVNAAFWALSIPTGYSGPLWVANGQAYNVGDTVQNPADLQFYQCIVPHTSGATFDGTKFGLLTPFDRYIGWNQVDGNGVALTPIGEFLRAWDKSPKFTTKRVEFTYWLSENGAQFTQLKHAIAFAWVYYRTQRPVLRGDAWDATAVYTSGRQAYYVGTGTGAAPINPGVGNFFTANQTTAAGDSPETAAAKWTVVALPYVFRGFLIAAGAADWLLSDGQEDKAAAAEAAAMGFLELEADKLHRQQGQDNRLIWRG